MRRFFVKNKLIILAEQTIICIFVPTKNKKNMQKDSIDIYPDFDGDEFSGTIPVAADVDGYYIEFDLHLYIKERRMRHSYDTPPETIRTREDIEIEDIRIYLEGDEITDIMANEDYDKVVEEIKNRLWIA